MIGTVRRIDLLTVLVLLLSGLFQPLAASRGVTCARAHAPAQAAEQPSGSAADDVSGTRTVSVEHAHDPAPQPDEPGVPGAPCGVAVLPSEQRLPSPAVTARHLLPPGDLPPASLLVQSLFRPPRLS